MGEACIAAAAAAAVAEDEEETEESVGGGVAELVKEKCIREGLLLLLGEESIRCPCCG